jgi:hypothetical protein
MKTLEFDPRKDRRNQTKHGLSLVLARDFAWDTARIEPDARRDYGELRYRAIGFIGARLHVVVFALRGEVIRVIGLRKANGRERKAYGQKEETSSH